MSVHFPFLICALYNHCCRCSFHQVSSCVIHFSLLFRSSFTRLLQKKKYDWVLCSAVFISRCISASRRLSFVRCELLIIFFRTPFAYYDRFELCRAQKNVLIVRYTSSFVHTLSVNMRCICMRLLALHNSFFVRCEFFLLLLLWFFFEISLL